MASTRERSMRIVEVIQDSLVRVGLFVESPTEANVGQR